jgi:hypothetical protein
VALSEAALSAATLGEAELAAGWAGASCANAKLLIKSAATAAFHADFISIPLTVMFLGFNV